MLTITNLRCKPKFICDIQFSDFHIIIIIVSSETYIYIYIYIHTYIYIYIYIHFPALVDDPSNLIIEDPLRQTQNRFKANERNC